MNLTASLIVRNELGRYLRPCIDHLLGFCDTIRVLDDGSDDGTYEHLAERDPRVQVARADGRRMFEHEGNARNALLAWTFAANPTHVLSVDADEFVSDGDAVRRAAEADEGDGAWTLNIEEVWKADAGALWTRQEGGWRSHEIPIMYRAPGRLGGKWRIQDRQLACGREPVAVRDLFRSAIPTGSSALHVGWTCVADRKPRYDRYVAADNGRFHNKRHLDSIMWPDSKIRFARREWPATLEPYRAELLARVNGAVAA